MLDHVLLEQPSNEVAIRPGRQAAAETLGSKDIPACTVGQGRPEADVWVDSGLQKGLQGPDFVVLGGPDQTLLAGILIDAAHVVV
jgi:hypothetical protein